MKIYTKGGDKGQTALLGGVRVSKSHMRIHAYGTIDELNSYVGLVSDQEINRDRQEFLRAIQSVLFIIGSHLAASPNQDTSKLPGINLEQVNKLEQAIDSMEEDLPALKSFLLPGGHQSVSFCHITRCVCRRAERLVIELNDFEPVEPIIIAYLNRLSDYLYVLSRKMGQELGVEEIPWKGNL
jgi:cob(I)alamin adenosyltransferase